MATLVAFQETKSSGKIIKENCDNRVVVIILRFQLHELTKIKT